MRRAVATSQTAKVAPPSVETSPKLAIPEMRNAPRRALRGDADRVADREVARLRRLLVDHDLVRARMPRRR